MSDLQPMFRALADPTRRSILNLLGHDALSVADVADKFDMTRAAVKKHLNVLSDGGLITVTQRGRQTLNAVTPGAMQPVLDWVQSLDAFWDDHLATLKFEIEKDSK
ncbi:MAG: ArsR/SmtB family transcription factor [Planktomarina sp.]